MPCCNLGTSSAAVTPRNDDVMAQLRNGSPEVTERFLSILGITGKIDLTEGVSEPSQERPESKQRPQVSGQSPGPILRATGSGLPIGRVNRTTMVTSIDGTTVYLADVMDEEEGMEMGSEKEDGEDIESEEEIEDEKGKNGEENERKEEQMGEEEQREEVEKERDKNDKDNWSIGSEPEDYVPDGAYMVGEAEPIFRIENMENLDLAMPPSMANSCLSLTSMTLPAEILTATVGTTPPPHAWASVETLTSMAEEEVEEEDQVEDCGCFGFFKIRQIFKSLKKCFRLN